jgi:DNA polymerase III subunit chi
MPQVDFYQLTRDPAYLVLPPIASRVLDEGRRLLVVSHDSEELTAISSALWAWRPESFLAHARAGEGGEMEQPILLSHSTEAANAARLVALADGIWREEALGFDRVFYLFPPDKTDDARDAWKALKDREGIERRYWKQDGGKWRQGP